MRNLIVVALALASGFIGNQAFAQGPQRRVVVPSVVPGANAQWSPRLGAQFVVQQIHLPQFGQFTAARITTTPVPGSPLRQIGLDVGDLITRLDGIPVVNHRELENHHLNTHVRYIKAGGQQVSQRQVYIQPNHYFADPYVTVNYPPSGPTYPTGPGLRP